ncbi:putative expression site-associated protein 5 (ESAG5) [Leptomonas pyrrhocoris]|uniref:Putative expression site-associated protein 5 (ESAG5) n=1 Tax=Leptomonas pyrrhocoris TaxID=157538 RepID=A0A0M9G5E3_LEPPY|nr:putative expression site-associated protein 5 (ESAG5) [Leptomonas pyrrhocoris]KPA82506.1 putative expression site-associated protein 5 (ESAG5) [Leptomonas pyrrhocoris]|eukprot:XP_015660945.1 putative expression site-associated protein 5 (ESAG5) [Leptomonas pyrrhocoris]
MAFVRDRAAKDERTTSTRSLKTLFVVFCLVLLSGALAMRGSFRDAFTRPMYVSEHRAYGEPDCRPANVAISVATSVINAFTQAVLIPALKAEINTAVIPEQEDDHIWVDQMVLMNFTLDSLTIETAAPDAQSVTINAKGFGLDVNETRFRYSYLGIRCYGHFTATLNETDIDTTIGFTLLPESYWNATFAQLSFAWGTLAIQHSLDSKACGIAQSIVELFTGQMDKYISEQVQKKLDVDGKRKATEVLNSRLADFYLRALSPPIMTPDRLAVVLDATPAPVGCPPQPAVSDLPPLLPRDIAAHTTVHDINNVLYNVALHGRLRWEDHLPDDMNTSLFSDVLPGVYEMCPECLMYTLVRASSPPVAVFLPVNTVTMTLRDVVVGLYVVPRTSAERDAVESFTSTHDFPSREKFIEVSRRLGIVDDYKSNAHSDIPVLALSCSATLGVRNVTFEKGRAVRYQVLRVDDFRVDVVASLIGDVDVVNVEQKGMEMWNEMAMPLINAKSPYKLPFFVRKAVLDMTLVKADAGFNIGLMSEFVSLIMRELS